MKLTKEHKTAIVVAIVLFTVLYFVTIVRNGTAW